MLRKKEAAFAGRLKPIEDAPTVPHIEHRVNRTATERTFQRADALIDALNRLTSRLRRKVVNGL